MWQKRGSAPIFSLVRTALYRMRYSLTSAFIGPRLRCKSCHSLINNTHAWVAPADKTRVFIRMTFASILLNGFGDLPCRLPTLFNIEARFSEADTYLAACSWVTAQ